MRLVSNKNSSIESFRDFYIAILIDREIDELKEICRANRKIYRGEQFLEPGYIFAPYIPVMVTPPIVSENNYQPTRGLMSRYAKKTIDEKFYGTIRLTDLLR